MKISREDYKKIPDERRNGEYDVYDGDEKIFTVQFIDGKITGKFIKFVDNKIKSIKTYKNNLLHGESKKFENDKVVLEEIWDEGCIIKRSECIGNEKITTKYDKKGNVIR